MWRTAAVFYAATLGKLVAGLFAQPLRPPAALCLGAASALCYARKSSAHPPSPVHG